MKWQWGKKDGYDILLMSSATITVGCFIIPEMCTSLWLDFFFYICYFLSVPSLPLLDQLRVRGKGAAVLGGRMNIQQIQMK